MKKLFSILLMAIYLLFNFNFIVDATDGKENQKIDPNIYEKSEIRIQQKRTDKDTQTQEIPKEQQNLSFEIRNKPMEIEVMDQLFQTEVVEKNTITTMAKNLELFSYTENETINEVITDQQANQVNYLQYFMILLVTVTVVILFFIFPKLMKN